MRRTIRSFGVAILAIGTMSCGSSIQVRTMAAPEGGLDQLQTFRLLPGPTRRDGRAVAGSDDPMVSNSIANRAMREQIVKTFNRLGYAQVDERSDFAVAFYATAQEVLDVSSWDYGYPPAPGWPRHGRPAQTVTQYTKGTVVVDVISAGTRLLLWRGEGSAELSDDPARNLERLIKVADAVVSRFPRARTPAVALGR